MTNKLRDILNNAVTQKMATTHGTDIHNKLQFVFIDGDNTRGAQDLITQIQARPNLLPFFGPNSRTEVPIAETIDGRVISRRIDRLNIDHNTKTIDILDYKTDINKNTYREKYIAQISEYANILRKIYPDYTIGGFILYIHDWALEKVC